MTGSQWVSRRYVVVGASRGLGFEVARELLLAGSAVLAISRDEDDLEQAVQAWVSDEPQSNVLVLAQDMGSSTAAGVLSARLESWGPVDGLVVCAGAGRPSTGSSTDRLTNMMKENVFPALNSVDGVRGHLLDSGRASIVLVTSIAGHERIACPPEYAAAKAALSAYTVHMAAQFAPVRVNAIAPGNMMTDGSIWKRMSREEPAKLADFLAREVPLQRVGGADEVAAAVLFLLSESASFVTGTVLAVDGGQSRSFR